MPQLEKSPRSNEDPAQPEINKQTKADIYSFTVLKARNLKSECQQNHTSSEGLGQDPSWSLPTSGVSWHPLASGSIAPIPAPVLT